MQEWTPTNTVMEVLFKLGTKQLTSIQPEKDIWIWFNSMEQWTLFHVFFIFINSVNSAAKVSFILNELESIYRNLADDWALSESTTLKFFSLVILSFLHLRCLSYNIWLIKLPNIEWVLDLDWTELTQNVLVWTEGKLSPNCLRVEFLWIFVSQIIVDSFWLAW